MLNANAKAWVDALRRGEYKQGRQVLRAMDGHFCCLGVACDLALKAGIEMEVVPDTTHDDDGFMKGCFSYDSFATRLPNKVKDWLGLNTKGGSYISLNDHQSLISLNDTGKSFQEIANVIESEPKGLFR